VVVSGSAAEAAPARPAATKDCGIITCSIYLSRSETQRAAEIALPHLRTAQSAANAAATVCAAGGPAVALACRISIRVRFKNFRDSLQGARDGHGCLRIRFAPTPNPPYATIWSFHNDGGKYCKD
jgi:hypothetical protein